jgi:CRP-like cAMP-binding protein
MILSTIEKVLFLKSIHLFDRIPSEQLVKVAEIAQEVEFEPDEYFIKQGEPGDCLYVVVEGEASVVLAGVGVVSQIQAKGVLGEMALLSGEPRSASCVAKGQLLTLKIERNDFWALLEERPEISLGIIKMLVQNLNLANRQLQNQQTNVDV